MRKFRDRSTIALSGSNITGTGLVDTAVAVLAASLPVLLFLMWQQFDLNMWGLLFLIAVLAVPVCSVILVMGSLTSRQSAQAGLVREYADSAADGTLITDIDGRIHYSNEAYAALTGSERAGRVRTLERVLAGMPEASESVYRLTQAAREKRRLQVELRLQLPNGESNGSARWYRIEVRPLELNSRSKPDKFHFVVWNVSEITQYRTEQEDAYVKYQRSMNFLDFLPVGFFANDMEGRVIYMNRTLADWLGYGQQWSASVSNISEIVCGNDVGMLRSLRSDEGRNHPEKADVDLMDRDGRNLPVRILHSIPFGRGSHQKDSGNIVLNRSPGEVSGEALRSAEVKFARLFNITPVALATLNGNGEIGRTNGEFLKLFEKYRDNSKERVNLIELVPSESGRKLRKSFESVRNGEVVPPVEIALTEEKDGPSATVHLASVEGEGDDEVFFVHALETTRQRELETQFAQSQKMQAIGHLAGGVAHDFNNVLTAIIGAADFLLGSHRDTDPSFQDIMSIKNNANRAAALVRQLLAFSRRQTLRPTELQLNDVLTDLYLMLNRLLGEKVDLKFDHGRNLWPVLVDQTQFDQVIINLAVNANDAMPGGGELTIRTLNVPEADLHGFKGTEDMPRSDYVLVEVADNGPGMSGEVIERIFDPFFSTKDVGKGTGLGLSTVYGIVKQTGGYVYAESELGKGTAFRVFLPRFEGSPEKAVDSDGKDIGTAVDLTGNATILLVEDEDAVRTFAKRALISRGYVVHEAATGAEALEAFNSVGGGIDLVVSDVVMPEMDGPTMLVELRKIRPDLKVIFVSGYAEGAFEKNLPDNEEFTFIPKPFSLKQLTASVKQVLDGG